MMVLFFNKMMIFVDIRLIMMFDDIILFDKVILLMGLILLL
jgi:hypothetical protein